MPHRFCDDFENFEITRYASTETSNAALSVVKDGGLQSSSALLITTQPVSDTSNNCAASLGIQLKGGTKFRFTFAIRILEKGEGRYRAVQFNFKDKAYTLQLWLNGPDNRLAVGSFVTGGAYNEYPSSEPTFDAEWHEVQMSVDLSSKLVSILVDGERLALKPTSFPLPVGANDPIVQFGAARVFTPSTRWRVQYDNVRVDELPLP